MSKNIEIDIVKKSKKWDEFKNAEKEIAEITKKLISLSEISVFRNHLELSISLVSDSQIKKINNEYRQKNKATNVLSFSFLDESEMRKNGFAKYSKNLPNIFLGDIILAFETIKKEAIKEKKKFSDHLTHLILHALLHLIGYDHENGKMAKKMEEIEIEILKKLKIKNPYNQ